ncbi:MAG: hypothetical protein ACYC4L_22445 [Chloroflexota bacterium]
MTSADRLRLLAATHQQARPRLAREYGRAERFSGPFLVDLYHLATTAFILGALAVGSWLFPM